MEENNFCIKQMSRADLDIAITWAANEGWNPGLHDANSFYTLDPKGFFGGYLNGQLISCISAISYGENFGFLGLYITKPEFRGKGYGFKVWTEALKYLSTQNIGLDGVVEQQESYKKSGFKYAYKNIRFEGRSKHFPSSEFRSIRKITLKDLDTILEYDQDVFPANRHNFLKSWICMPDSFGFIAEHNGEILGYSHIRKCQNGYKIGPLFANNYPVAEELFKAMNSVMLIDTPYFLDIPEPNTDALKLVEQHNMKYQFETARMYTKQQPNINLNKIFGITTFEVG